MSTKASSATTQLSAQLVPEQNRVFAWNVRPMTTAQKRISRVLSTKLAFLDAHLPLRSEMTWYRRKMSDLAPWKL